MTQEIVFGVEKDTFPIVEEENNSMLTSSTSPEDEKLSLIVNGTDESCSSFPSTKELQHTIAESNIPQDEISESVIGESLVSAKVDSFPSYSTQKSSSPTIDKVLPIVTSQPPVVSQQAVPLNADSIPPVKESDVPSFHPEHAVTFTTTDEMLMSLPLGSRLFLGRLAAEKTDRNELASIFAKYGPIHEISLKSTFGFIQFDSAEACQAAILHEQGRVIGGLSVDLNVSKDRPRKGQAGSDLRKEQQRRGGRDFDRSSSDRRDNRSRPYPRKVSRSRSPSPYRRDRDRGRYSIYDDPRDSRRSSDSNPLPRRYGSSVPTIQLVILGDVERNYLNQIENAFSRSGLGFDTMYLGPKMNLGAAVSQLKSEGVKAIVFLNKQLERSGRVAMQHFKSNGQVQEYESILPDAAIEIYNRESREDGAGLASMIAGLASAAQSQGQVLDPNTIAALASLAQGGQTQNPPQGMYSTGPKVGNYPNYQMGQMPPVSQAVNPNLAAILSSLGGPQQNYPMMGYSQVPSLPSYPTSGYRSAAPIMMNNKPMQSQSQPIPAPKSDSVADILSRLKNLADIQKR